MFSSNTYTIRAAGGDDEAALRRLAGLDSQRAISGPALVGMIDGTPAAAISLSDGRVVADPFQRTDALAAHLRVRAGAVRALERTPSLRDRIRAGLRTRHAAPGRA